MDCLVLDQGNTSLKWGVFKHRCWVEGGKITNENLDSELNHLQSLFPLPFFYSSVRSEQEQQIFLLQYPFCKRIPSAAFPASQYASGKPGRDRLANVAGATEKFGFSEAFIVDFGTCITYGLSKNNELISGAISLGAQSRLRGMHEFTGQLPRLDLEVVESVFKDTTQGAMLSSVNFGIVSELAGYIEAARLISPEIPVVFTGTDAPYFAKQLNYRIFVELNLTLIGLYAISCANEF